MQTQSGKPRSLIPTARLSVPSGSIIDLENTVSVGEDSLAFDEQLFFGFNHEVPHVEELMTFIG